MNASLDFPIFLVGCSRSGTTLLQSLLAAHPEVASFPESQFFHHLLPSPYERRRYALGLVSGRLRPRLEQFFRDEMNRPELVESLPRILFMGYYTRQFMAMLQNLAREQNKTILIEKTPDHIYYIESIEKFLPHARFIHLIRSGADVIASLYEVTHKYPEPWGGARNIDVCINDWLRAIAASEKYLPASNHIGVRYEQLLQEPEVVLKKLCEFIGIEFSQQMILNYRSEAEKLSLDNAGRQVSQSFASRNSQKFYQVFNPIEQQYILDQIAQVNLDKLPHQSSD
ncbi:MAG: sulfotransferase [Oscillatoriales cyanobacterium RM2_1_1]|nr:sulfotransferase [Oscillatoriales cyanobacterium SM2_3_0]NJO46013.1 sulfotransferase [Oscillatoriales cyanobacterium RM2_1_1]